MRGLAPRSRFVTFHPNGTVPLIDNVVPGMREADNPWENNRISIEFVMYVYDEDQYVGQDYWIGAAVELGTDKIWAGQMQISVINKTETTTIVSA